MNKLAFLGLLVFLFSCEEPEDIDQEDATSLTDLTDTQGESGISYTESSEDWDSLKIANGNSYMYQTTFTSFSGLSSTTEVQVTNGVVTSRLYVEYQANENGGKNLTDSYTETSTTIGTHEKGAGVLTIDDLYNSCASEYLVVDKTNNTIYFETEINGLMTMCGYLPNNCADDCYVGFSISSFDWVD